MKKLYIIADDYGISSGVNRGIEELAKLEYITGTSAMATGIAINQISDFVEKMPKIDVGIHLDLISNSLLSDLKLNLSPPKLALKLLFDKTLLYKIEKEFRLQIEFLLKKTKITHIDSHRHVHFIPQIFRIVNNLADEYGIDRIRIPVPKINFKNLKFIFSRKDFYKFFPFFIWKFFNKTNASSLDNFFGLFQVGNLTEKYLNYVFNEEFNFAELMIHPGYVDETLKNLNENLLYERENELETIKNFFNNFKDEI